MMAERARMSARPACAVHQPLGADSMGVMLLLLCTCCSSRE